MFQWKHLVKEVQKQPPWKNMVVPKSSVPHPSRAGFRRTLGEPKFQIADWSKGLRNGGRIHIIEFSRHYEVHWDKVDPAVDPAGHLAVDAPQWLAMVAFILILLIIAIPMMIISRK